MSKLLYGLLAFMLVGCVQAVAETKDPAAPPVARQVIVLQGVEKAPLAERGNTYHARSQERRSAVMPNQRSLSKRHPAWQQVFDMRRSPDGPGIEDGTETGGGKRGGKRIS